MNYSRTHKIGLIFSWVIIAITFATIIYAEFIMPSPDPEYLELIQTGKFAIGHARGTSQWKIMRYEFEADGQMYKCSWGIVQNQRIIGGNAPARDFLKRGEKKDYLTIYDPSEPQKMSVLRIDCPIRDSADFRRYVQEFEQLRKEGRIKLRATLNQMISE